MTAIAGRAASGRLRRWRWVLRVALVLLVVGSALVGFHWQWGRWAQRRLDARLAALKASGEPVYPADFDPPAPPPGQNAADDLIAAGALLAASPEFAAIQELDLAPPLSDEHGRTIALALAANEQAITLAEAAAAKPQVRWQIDPGRPVLFQKLPGLNEARAAANLFRVDALLAHHGGDHARAVRRVRQMLELAQHVDRQPALVAHLTAVGMTAMASATAENLAPDLGADRPAVRGLIDALLDDGPSRAGLVWALRGERRDQAQTVAHMLAGEFAFGTPADGRPPPAPEMSRLRAFEVRPMFLSNADLMVRVDTALVAAFERSADLPTYRAAAHVPTLFPEIERSPQWYKLSTILLPSLDRAVQAQYRLATDRRLAAVALAIRLHAIDHAGRLPRTLDELVPNYLPAVPADPQLAGGAKLRYVPDADRPIVYSAGDNATDDGGDSRPRPSGRRDDDGGPADRWDAKDAVLELKRRPRAD